MAVGKEGKREQRKPEEVGGEEGRERKGKGLEGGVGRTRDSEQSPANERQGIDKEQTRVLRSKRQGYAALWTRMKRGGKRMEKEQGGRDIECHATWTPEEQSRAEWMAVEAGAAPSVSADQ